MTGFGKSVIKTDTYQCVIEVRSLNSRYTEVRVQGLKEMLELEFELIQKIKKKFLRGKFDVQVKLTQLKSDWAERERRVLEHHKYLKVLARKMGFEDKDITFETVLSTHALKGTRLKAPKIKKTVDLCLSEALKNLEGGRIQEGNMLLADIQRRAKAMQKDLSIIERRMNSQVKRRTSTLKKRIADLTSLEEFDKQRMELEVAILVEKSDVTEELVRLKSHFDTFEKSLKVQKELQKGVGRKLDFFVQEIHRELNTIGSKANDAFVTNKVVALKSQLEKIREQVQNLE